jgi:predicted MFS family arabinose efflux permease
VIGLGQFAAVVGGWNPDRRGLAIGITFAGTGLGALVFIPLCERLISFLGWQTAYLILASMCFIVLAPLLAWGERKPPIPL